MPVFEHKYNVNDMVFILHKVDAVEENKTRDVSAWIDRDLWYIVCNCSIDEVLFSRQKLGDRTVSYKVGGDCHLEENCFVSFEEAAKECKTRNE